MPWGQVWSMYTGFRRRRLAFPPAAYSRSDNIVGRWTIVKNHLPAVLRSHQTILRSPWADARLPKISGTTLRLT